MLGALYQADTDRALDNLATAPLQPVAPKPSFKQSVWAQPVRGLAAGLGDLAAGASELGVGAYRTLQHVGSTDERPAGWISGETEFSRDVRKVARAYRPDPATAGLAENVVFDLARIVPKAAGYMAAMGPVGGATALGVDEALTVEDDLKAKGVDEATRQKVAGVAGLVTAATVGLPIAGQTIKGTLGLYAVGGPGAYVAQQAVTREILKGADYHDLAKQYDPMDGVGLAFSALAPLPFVGFALARNLKGPRLAPEQLDAVMVNHERAHLEAKGPEAPQAFDALVERDQVPAVRTPEPELPAGETKPAKPETKPAFEAVDERFKEVIERAKQAAAEGADDELGTIDAALLKVAAECSLT